MNCPGHMLLFGSAAAQLPRPAAPLRRGVRRCTATSSPARCTGCTRVRHVTQDDAHIFCTEEQIEAEIDGCLDYAALPLRPLRAGAARRALDPAGEQARHRRGVGLRRGRARRPRSSGTGSTYVVNAGDGAFYGPKIDLHMTRRRSAARGRSGRSSSTARCRSGSASPTWAPTTREHPPVVIHRALFGSLERFIGILIEHYGGAFPFWLAPVQVRVAAGRRAAPRRRRRRSRRSSARPASASSVDEPTRRRQADPRRRAREDPLRRRLRRP